MLGFVMHAYNSSIWETEAGENSSRPVPQTAMWFTGKHVPLERGTLNKLIRHRKTLCIISHLWFLDFIYKHKIIRVCVCVCVEASLSRETKENNESEDSREKGGGGGLKGSIGNSITCRKC